MGKWYRKYVEEKFKSNERALKLQAKENKRRLNVLNGEGDRIKEILKESIPREVFDRTMEQKDEKFDRAINQLKATSEERYRILTEANKVTSEYQIKQQGSLVVLQRILSAALAVLVGVVIYMLTKK
jgi:hypothetical protein